MGEHVRELRVAPGRRRVVKRSEFISETASDRDETCWPVRGIHILLLTQPGVMGRNAAL